MSTLTNIRKTLEASIAQFFGIFTAVVRTKLISIRLGSEAFAVLGQLAHLSQIYTFLYGMGMGSRVVALIAERRSEGNEAGRRKVELTYTVVVFWAGLLLAVGTLLFHGFISQQLFPGFNKTWYVQVIGLSLVFEALNTLYITFVNGRKLTRMMVGLSMAGNLLSAVSVVTLMWLFGLDGAVWSILATAVLNLGVTVALCLVYRIPLYPGGMFRFSQFDGRLFRSLLVFGLASIYTGVLFQFQMLYLKQYFTAQVGLEATGYYHAVMTLASRYLGIFMLGINYYFMPHFAEQRSDADLCREVNSGIRALQLLIFPVLVGLFVFAPEVLWLLYAKEFVQATGQLQLVLLAYGIRVSSALLACVWVARNQTRFWILNDTLSAILLVGGSLLLFPVLGIEGSLVAYAIATLLTFGLQLGFAWRLIGYRPEGRVLSLLLLTLASLAALLAYSRLMITLPYYRLGMILLGFALVVLVFGVSVRRSELQSAYARLRTKPGR
jgi:PST family polysaccharide transporter